MTKTKATLIHLSLSIIVIGLFILTVLYIWYPQPFFAISGVIEPLKLLIIVDVIVGPLLTFIVYKKGKKNLKFDVSVIIIMQIVALIYGAFTIYSGRAGLLVVNNGQFYYLAEKFASNDELQFAELKPSIFTPPKMAYMPSSNYLDVYSAYAEFVPLDSFEEMLLPYSLSVANMQAQFSSKQEQIELLSKKYSTEDIVFFILDKENIKYYVVFSIKQNRIIDYLKF